jgi:hypothetical protein
MIACAISLKELTWRTSGPCSKRPHIFVPDYLIELQRHAQKLATKPAEWMPWNYRETLERIVSLSDSA